MRRFFQFILTTFFVSALTINMAGCGSSNSTNRPEDTSVVWAVGNSDANGYAAVYRSDNGGTTWYRPDANATMLEGFDAENLYVVDENDVWIVGTQQSVVHTINGGLTWEKFATFPDNNTSMQFYSISGLSVTEFWISGSDGAVYHTRDGAVHWDKMDPAAFHNGLVQGIKAIDRLTVYAVGKPDGNGTGFVSRTLDGGQTWEAVTLPDNYNDNEWIGVKATDKEHVVVYGCKGHYSATTDGGATWTNGLINVSGGIDGADINDLVMVDDMRWWNAMDLDNIFLTLNGGGAWTQQNSSGVSNMFLLGIDAADASHAVIAGMSAGYPQIGKLLLTRDGGATWTQQLLTEFPMQKVAFAHPTELNTTEEKGTMFASTLRSSFQGLLWGATSDLGSHIMGLILNKLGWGSQGDDADNKLLESMNAKLVTILKDLKTIENEMTTYAEQIEMKLDQIDTDVNYPTDQVDGIFGVQVDFNASFADKKAGTVDTGDILWFTDNKIYGNDMENLVYTITGAVYPDYTGSGATPLLQSLLSEMDGKEALGYITLADEFDIIETYTSRLLYNQLRGVNLLVEAMHVDANGSGRCPSPEDNNTCVKEYMAEYQEMLEDMVSNPGINTNSYIATAYQLALEHINPLPYKSGQAYFDSVTTDKLARAEFYRLMATQSATFGPRLLVLTTKDFTDKFNFYIETEASRLGFLCSAPIGIAGDTYAYWDGDKIMPENNYSTYECFIPSDTYSPTVIKPGTYDIYDDSVQNETVYGTIVVKTYDENYTAVDDGNFSYGHAVIVRRGNQNHFSQNSPSWQMSEIDLNHAGTYGWFPWGSGILGETNGELDYGGLYTLYSNFQYTGKTEQKLCIDYDAKYHMVTGSEDGCEAEAYVHFGVWDDTDNEHAGGDGGLFYHHTQDIVDEGNIDKYYYPKGVYCYTAKPDHHYHVYFNMHVYGHSGLLYKSADVHSRIFLDKIDYIYLHF